MRAWERGSAMADERVVRGGHRCASCGHRMATSLLACPVCHGLVHAERLKNLSQKASEQETQNDVAAALQSWRDALALLPTDTKQYTAIQSRVQELSQRVDSDATPAETAGANTGTDASGNKWAKGVAGVGALSLLLWKFKFVFAFLLTKGKLLILGLTKAGTLFSMLASFGLYWSVWGWKFALGLILSIYVHEMGHVAALRKFGIRASAPTFIPGIGAMVRMRQQPASSLENARVGLAGPLWGLGAAIAAYFVFLATGEAIFAAIARVGAWINLFNLLPMLPLDGGRGFQSLNRKQRWKAVAAIGAAWFLTGEGLLVLLLIAGFIYACRKERSSQSDPTALYQYIGLLAVLSWMCTLAVPVQG